MFENVNIDWNLSHDDGSTDFSDEETLEDQQQQPRTLTRTPDRKARPMSVYTTPILNNGGLLHSPPSGGGGAPLAGAESSSALEDSPDNGNGAGNRSNSSDWSRSSNNTSDSGDSPAATATPSCRLRRRPSPRSPLSVS